MGENIRVGTSSWADPGFVEEWYPPDLPARHSGSLSSLPEPLREHAGTGARGRVRLTKKLEAALADAVLEAVAPLADAGKLATFLLQLSPGFSPHRHELDELASLVERLAPHPVGAG